MNVSLTPELEALVRDKVESGRYLSASEVVREALRLLEQRDELQRVRQEALRRDIREGLDSGRGEELDMSRIRQKAKAKRESGK